MSKTIKKEAQVVTNQRKSYTSQADIPSYTMEEALRIPKAIVENYASGPVTPIQLAQALKLTPSASGFRMLCGAAIAYGLTEGGYNATEIKITELAKRVFKPQQEGDDLIAKREAFLKPRIISTFIAKYDGNLIPRNDIACNVLESFGVGSDRTVEIFNSIILEGTRLGLIKEIKGKNFVDLKGAEMIKKEDLIFDEQKEMFVGKTFQEEKPIEQNISAIVDSNVVIIDAQKKKKVYISHGKDISFVEPIKKLLKFGEMEAVVSIEKQSVSKPVPDKVMTDMRNCGAAIIHVDAEQKLLDKDAKEHLMLNANVLIEIGAAMALYGRRFILLVKNGITLPSNLQGLYEVRYEGEQLSGDVTIKLLEAINDIKNQSLPE
ncbi:MAG TPA: TIR domain-containing protein [Ferruginibacter sp.]|nr:TIR domain-containing protein [Ferruginibacter sp.]